MNRITRILAGLAVMAVAIPAIAQVTDEDIDRAREEVNAMVAEYQQLGQDVQDAWARQYVLEGEIAELQASIEVARARIAESEQKLEEVAVEMYMGSTSGAAIQILFSLGDDGYEAGLEYLRNVSGEEVDIVNQLRSFRAELDRQTLRLADASDEQAIVTAHLEEMAAELEANLTAAQAVYDELVAQQAAEEEARRLAEEEARRRAEEAARQATSTTAVASTTSTSVPPTTSSTESTTTTTISPPPPTTDGGTCPVAGATSFTDSWGEPRSGGRTHQGIDLIAARNTPVVAIYAGTIKRITTGSLSGLAVWLRAENGDEYFYAHLESYGEITVGQSVAEGHVIGYVGTSGNAPEWLPHLHFEQHPGGGPAVNPYPLVKAVCG